MNAGSFVCDLWCERTSLDRWTVRRVLHGSLGEQKAMAERRIWVSMSEPSLKRVKRNIRDRNPSAAFCWVRRRDSCLDADELSDWPSVLIDHQRRCEKRTFRSLVVGNKSSIWKDGFCYPEREFCGKLIVVLLDCQPARLLQAGVEDEEGFELILRVPISR